MKDKKFGILVEELKNYLKLTIQESYKSGNYDTSKRYDIARYEHSVAVANLAWVMGYKEGLSEENKQNLYIAGLLHDIAKYTGHEDGHDAIGAKITYKLLKKYIDILNEKRIEVICDCIKDHSNKTKDDKRGLLAQIIIEADVLEKLNVNRYALRVDIFGVDDVINIIYKILKKLIKRDNYLVTSSGKAYYKKNIVSFITFVQKIMTEATVD